MCFRIHNAKWYYSKFADDEKWQGYFTGAWVKSFLIWVSTCLGDIESDPTVPALLKEGALDDEYRRLKAMLETAMSFEKD